MFFVAEMLCGGGQMGAEQVKIERVYVPAKGISDRRVEHISRWTRSGIWTIHSIRLNEYEFGTC